MTYLTKEDIEEVNRDFPEHDRESCGNIETYTRPSVGFSSEHGGVHCLRCQAFFEKEADKKSERLAQLEEILEALKKSLAIANKKPTLKEFCVKAGCYVVKGDFRKKGYSGDFAWCIDNKDNVKFLGFKTENQAYTAFLEEMTTPTISKQIKKLLRK